MIGRVATFSQINYLMTLNMSTQTSLNAVENQESSGLKAQTYGTLSGDVSKVLNIDNQISRLTTDGNNATEALSSMQESYSVLGSVTDLASTMLSDLSSYMSGTGTDSSTVSASAQSWLSQLTNLMNTQYAGSYLFGGQSTDTAPVDTSSSSYSPTTDPTASDTGYYQGSSDGTTYTGSDGFSVSTSVQASDPGFEKLFRALSLIVASPSSSSTLSQAYSLIQTGESEVSNSQTQLAGASSALTNYQTDASTKVSTLSTLASSLKDADLSAATVTVTNYQNQLEASYSAISKLLSVNLSKYLT
ncbi:MAG: flagellin [Caulobacteraceae bacterium]|nr:flagellin [Caulobacteraceae bacterium]